MVYNHCRCNQIHISTSATIVNDTGDPIVVGSYVRFVSEGDNREYSNSLGLDFLDSNQVVFKNFTDIIAKWRENWRETRNILGLVGGERILEIYLETTRVLASRPYYEIGYTDIEKRCRITIGSGDITISVRELEKSGKCRVIETTYGGDIKRLSF